MDENQITEIKRHLKANIKKEKKETSGKKSSARNT